MTTLVTPGGTLTSVSPAPTGAGSPFPRGFQLTSGPSAGTVPLLTREVAAMTYEGMYRIQPWVGAVIDKLTKSMARIPLNTYKYLDPELAARQRVKRGPLADVLRKPYPRMSPFRWKSISAWNTFVHGNAAVLKVRGGPGQPPSQLWPMPWRYVGTISDGPVGSPEAYVWHSPSTGDRYIIDPNDVIHFQLYDNGAPVSISPLEHLRRTLALEDAAQVWSGSYFEKGGFLSGSFTTEKKLDDKTLPRLRAELDAIYSGAENAGRFGIFDQGLKWEKSGSDPVNAALIEQRKLNREEVCGVYDMAPPNVGILDRATFNNITELHASLYQDTLGPPLTMFEETLDAQLVQPEVMWADLFLEFFLDEVLRGRPLEQAQADQALFMSGQKSPNDLRRARNEPPIKDPRADAVYVPLAMVPIGEGVDQAVELHARAAAAIPPATVVQDLSEPPKGTNVNDG